MPRAVQNAVLILLIGAGWGLLGPASKALYAVGPGVFDGFTVAVARAAWAFPLFLIGLAVMWRLEPPRLDARHWIAVAAAAVVFGLAISVSFTVAAQYTSVAHLSFLIGVSPVTNTALAALVFRTVLERRQIVALALGVVGIALLASTHSSDRSALLGDSLMLVWLAAFGTYACLLRFIGTRMRGGMTMCLVGSISMGLLLPPGLLLGYGGAIAHVTDGPVQAGWFFGEVVLGSALIAQTAYAAAVRRLGVSVATIGAEYTALAVGVIASVAAREHWTVLTAIGGLVLCAALAVTFVPIPGLRTREAASSAA